MNRVRSAWQPVHLRIALLLLAVVILLLMPLPRSFRELDALGDLGHAPLFGTLAALLYLWGRPWLPRWDWLAALCVWIVIAVIGVGSEFLQAQLGRNSSWSDAYADMLGAAAFLIWCLSYHWKGKAWRTVAIAVGIGCLIAAWRAPMLRMADTLIQRYEMPLMGSFERETELSRWQFPHCKIGRSSHWATQGEQSLVLEMLPAKYPSAILYWTPTDWSGYHTLSFDVLLHGSEPLQIVVKIEDDYPGREVDDRYNGQFTLHPNRNTIHIDLWDVVIAPKGRMLDLRHIRRLQIFTANLKEPRLLQLDNLRLNP